ncbi:hypothetical protein DFQ28_009340 [Apophysomyces sp. BC1034]|nr:hypothetical protein DFQ28_009340 [Apophysomyces sp. BC1034]
MPARRHPNRGSIEPQGCNRIASGILDHDGRKFRAHVARQLRDADRDPARDVTIDASDAPVRVGGHSRASSVGLLANADVQRQAAEQWHIILPADALAAAGAEDMLGVAAMGADMDAHVLNNAQDRHADLLEHLQALSRVEQRNVLRRRDDHRAGHRHALRERKLNVPGARRQVDDQVVQVAPVRLPEQLLERGRDHRAAPDHRVVLLDQESDRVGLHAVAFERGHRLTVFGRRPALDAEHHRLRRAINVRVQHANRRAFGRQRKRQVRGGGALADPALAGRDRDDIAHVRQQLHAALHRVRDDLLRYRHAHADYAWHRAQRLLDARADQPVLTPGRIAEHHVERHGIAIDRDIAHPFARGHRLRGIRVDHAGQRGVDPGPVDCHRCSVT